MSICEHTHFFFDMTTFAVDVSYVPGASSAPAPLRQRESPTDTGGILSNARVRPEGVLPNT